MRLADDECWRRLGTADHATLSTLHHERGVDAVPVVFAALHGTLVLPVDTVKPKAGTDLQRLRNLRDDPRCVVLVDHWDADWSRLWWVRLHGRAELTDPVAWPAGRDALVDRYPPYRAEGSVVGLIRVVPTRVRGWAAAAVGQVPAGE